MAFDIIDVPGDGDCLYHAVITAFLQKYNLLLTRTTQRLRRALATFIRSQGITDMAGGDAVHRLTTGGYGEDFEVRKLTELLSVVLRSRVCIMVFNGRPGVPNKYRWQTFSPDFAKVHTAASRQRRCGYTIHLFNSGQGASEHFRVLHDRNHKATKWLQ